MVTQVNVSVRSATDTDRSQLANLIHFEPYVHRHLDWRPPLDWIGNEPCLVAELQNKLDAVLICPPDLPSVAWIRLFAVRADMGAQAAWDLLWPAAQAVLEQKRPMSVAAIPLQPWYRSLLSSSGFKLIHNVVMLLWQSNTTAPDPPPISATIRPMNYDDLEAVEGIDGAAFGPLWHNSYDSLHSAFAQAAVATIVEDESGPIGYQISTASPMGGHLARLAIDPAAQGKGLGYALAYDLLDQFRRRGATRVTVNTQEDNLGSLALYRKLGFTQTGESFPVFELAL